MKGLECHDKKLRSNLSFSKLPPTAAWRGWGAVGEEGQEAREETGAKV